jgi:hypothetical protein
VYLAGEPVWRRVRVKGAVSIRGLNRVICRVFGWALSHEYTLRVRRPWERQTDEAVVSRAQVRVADLVGEGDSLSLGYRYGRSWLVDAVVERVGPATTWPAAECLGGAGWVGEWRPPTEGYQDLTLALSKAEHDWHDHAMRLRREGIEAESGMPVDAQGLNVELRRGRYGLSHRQPERREDAVEAPSAAMTAGMACCLSARRDRPALLGASGGGGRMPAALGVDLSAAWGWPARGMSPPLRWASRPRLRR